MSGDSRGHQQIVPGISITPSGMATVDPSLSGVLFDLALRLEEPTNLPVDVEHVLAAIVLAVRKRDLDPNKSLTSDDPALAAMLVSHVKAVFTELAAKLAGRIEIPSPQGSEKDQ